MPSEEKPLPCPFCGEQPVLKMAMASQLRRIQCEGDCSIRPRTDWFDDVEEALKVWNARHAAAELASSPMPAGEGEPAPKIVTHPSQMSAEALVAGAVAETRPMWQRLP